MKRGYAKEWFINRCNKIRKLVPNVRISTDIIVGFPDESDEDFQDTIDVINTVRFEQIFNFKYSPRPETEALNMQNQISDDISSKRLSDVIELHKQHQVEHMDRYLDSTMDVFFEDLKPNGEIMGFSDNYCQVFVKASEELLGQTAKVKIIQTNRTSLKGELIE